MLQLGSHVKKLLIAVAASAALYAPAANAAVWVPQNTWTPAWEAAYQNWVRTEWTKDFFLKPGPYQGLILDCADAVYAMRYIFAAENSLPFAINDPSGGRGTISQASTRYDRLAPQARKVTFLKYLAGALGTQSLVGDSYPLAANREAIHAGVFLRSDAVNHHSWTVKDVSRTGIPYLIYATRPASPKLYSRKEFPSMGFLFNNDNRVERAAGFRMFRSEQDLKTPEWQLPNFSLDQYQIPIAKWKDTMNVKLRLAEETLEEKIDRVLVDACSGAHERIGFVQEALDFQAKADAEGRYCLNAVEYDDSSTPSRDTRLRDSFVELDAAVARAKRKGIALNPALQQKVDEYNLKEASGHLGRKAYCAIEYKPGSFLTLGQVAKLSVDKRLSGDPNETIDVRWGQAYGPTDRSARCPKY
jgi:hypothetical protein